ncbi:MAG TPA: pyruvate/2-oxoglutarate dehydrogenase complex,dihydrolipoamide dehydrogenase (E3) component [Cyanobacteria bacterium UBA8803]|nr:pyruvate/2-oxoglutarate dehydrogenase complex,dihydrolipoamide dehydrogenase (E3) component [Cyanobacteria bacterium UBA9273]HBL62338.1 pyruvate/2-oxoglutarate dehydrogenase complex,dihydrolipoamide dehydrogenase (E3) component [Cyanobacteria bacterium UBA8803]
MAILDSKGRLFGKVSILDLGAALVILLVVVGVFFFPGTSGSVAQLNQTKPIEVDAIVRGLSVRNPEALITQFKEKKKTNIIIRNQPYGQVDIKSVKELARTLAVPQPDGSVKELPDPRSNSFSADMLMTLGGQATMTKDGPVLGNSKIKIGTPIELEGTDYNFNASVIEVRIAN